MPGDNIRFVEPILSWKRQEIYDITGNEFEPIQVYDVFRLILVDFFSVSYMNFGWLSVGVWAYVLRVASCGLDQ